MNWPLNPPPAGEIKMTPLMFEPGTKIGKMVVTDASVFLQVEKPAEEVDGQPVEAAVYFMPEDPVKKRHFLSPRGAELTCANTAYLGKIEGPNGTHAVILKQK